MKYVLLAIAAIAPTAARAPSVVEMTREMTYQPREITVTAGEVVVWKNVAEVAHTVNTVPENCRSEDGKQWIKIPPGATAFFSGEIKPGEEFRVRFEVPGTYQYLCTFHEHATMRGRVVVMGAEAK